MDGKIGLPPDAPYVSAKFALTGFCGGAPTGSERSRYRGHKCAARAGGYGDDRTPALLVGLPKISPESVARSIIDAIRKRKPIVIVPPQAKLLYYINVFAPRLSDRLSRFFRLEGWTN